MKALLIKNFLLFQLGWFACVLGGAHQHATAGSMVALGVIFLHCYQANDHWKESTLLMIALVFGFIFESMVTTFGIASYHDGQLAKHIAPHWMIIMWPLFATTLNLSMSWLKKLPLYVSSLTGALFAPLAYYAGFKLGAVVYQDIEVSLAIISLAWAALLPVLVYFSRFYDGYSPDSKDISMSKLAQEKQAIKHV